MVQRPIKFHGLSICTSHSFRNHESTISKTYILRMALMQVEVVRFLALKGAKKVNIGTKIKLADPLSEPPHFHSAYKGRQGDVHVQ